MNQHDDNPQAATNDPPQRPEETTDPKLPASDYVFAEPELGKAEISSDAAEQVDLEAVAAEAAKVEREAELSADAPASKLVPEMPVAPPIGATPTEPEDDASPGDDSAADSSADDVDSPDWGDGGATILRTDFTQAPVASNPWTNPVADAPETSNAAGTEPSQRTGHGVDDGSGWRRPETPWQQSQTPWQPKENAWQSPGQMAQGQMVQGQADATAPTATTTPASGGPAYPAPGGPQYPNNGQYAGPQAYPGGPQGGAPQNNAAQNGGPKGNTKIFIILGAVLVAVVLLGLLIWLAVGLLSGLNKTGTSSDSDVGTDVSSLDWKAGDCFEPFVDVTTPTNVVPCSEPHSAQLVATFYYPDNSDFPGKDVLSEKGNSVCDKVKLTAATTGLSQTVAYPSEETWTNKKDRRVDCIVSRSDNAPLTKSLIK